MKPDTKPAFTAGPWIARNDDITKVKKYIVQSSKTPQRDVPLVAMVSEGNPSHEANARLIAATPELLEAAVRLCVMAQPGHRHDRAVFEVCPDEIEQLRAAIAKATQ